MVYRLLADTVAVVHAGFVVFVALGGLLVWRWPRVAWVHVPAVAWGVLVELAGWLCPLTPLELELRRHAGESGYSGGFVEEYLMPALYPEDLTRAVQIGLGLLALLLNAAIYALVVRRVRRQGGGGDEPT